MKKNFDSKVELSYRMPMQVNEVIVYKKKSGHFGECNGFPVCPRCKISMEREYQAFCDRCGQKLGWKKYKHAKVIFPGSRKT